MKEDKISMILITWKVGFLNTNCYLAADPATLDCVLIDPGAESRKILEYIRSGGYHLRGMLLTHAHFDHFGAMWPVYERYPVPVYMNARDLAPVVNIGARRFVPPKDTVYICDGDEIRVGPLYFQVVECPGHTPGSVAYICGDMLFSGDTLFHMECGRCDYPCSTPIDLAASLSRLRELPGDYRLLPGHHESSTLDYEREHNPWLQPGIIFREPEEDEDDFFPDKI